MIQAHELRIGNVILRKGKPFFVDLWTFVQIHQYLSDPKDFLAECEPLPLSPGVLTQLGFTSDIYFEGDRPIYGNGKMSIDWDTLQPTDCGFAIAQLPITSAHQLQNLYYSLMGEELDYKL